MWFKKWRKKKKYLTLMKTKYLSVYLMLDYYIALHIFPGNKEKLISVGRDGIRYTYCDPGG